MNLFLLFSAALTHVASLFLALPSILLGDAVPVVFDPTPTLGPLLFGFALLLILFVLINADRRFREYVSRALVRPFNFFADIRDQRLIPGAQTTLLAVIVAGGMGLCFAGLLRLMFQVPSSEATLRLALPNGIYATLIGWAKDYTSLLVWMTLISLAVIVFITLLLRFIAIFVRGRIMFADTFNVEVWSLLPMTFLLPFDLILPRLDADSTTITLTIVLLGVLKLWSFYRLLKGTGVLFDIYPTKIYLYGTIILGAVITILYFYLQQNHVFANFSHSGSVIGATASLSCSGLTSLL